MTKAEIRQRVWQTIEREGVGRFPGTTGRIPNFIGAEHAAQLLREMAVWRRALVVKINPDAPQLPVQDLPNETLAFLLPSRYCEVDKLTDIAWKLFGETEPGFASGLLSFCTISQ